MKTGTNIAKGVFSMGLDFISGKEVDPSKLADTAMKEGVKLGKTTVSGVVSTQLKPKGKTLANKVTSKAANKVPSKAVNKVVPNKAPNKVPNSKKSLHNGVEKRKENENNDEE